MQFKLSTVVALFAAVSAVAAVPLQKRIASDQLSACNPPNNGDHKQGSECKWLNSTPYSNPYFSGTCQPDAYGRLACESSSHKVRDLERRVAADKISACNGPNNGDHKEGSSCKFLNATPFSSDYSGTCKRNAYWQLECMI